MLLMGKLTISMAIFNSYVSLPEGTSQTGWCIVFMMENPSEMDDLALNGWFGPRNYK